METVKQLIKEIQLNNETRKQLISLKQEIKKHSAIQLRELITVDFLKPLLSHEDVKVRKNALIIIRELKLDEFKDELFKYYEQEENWIVKVEIINTLTSFDLKNDLEQIKNILTHLSQDTDNNSKHIEIIRAKLNEQLASESGNHQFIGFNQPTDVILTTLETNRNIVYEAIDSKLKKEVSIGVLTRIKDIEEVFKIRDFDEILIPLKKVKNASFEIEQLAKMIIESELTDILKTSHESVDVAFRFRIDSSRINPDRLKNDYIKKLGLKLQQFSNGYLLNSTSNYEIELRLVETSKQTCQVFLKLYTLKDPRFVYRKYAISTSMQPYVAASIVNLIYPYTKEDADVLDLCCGTGTLLIERFKLGKCHFLMGTDIFGEAIEKAKYNSQLANVNAHYIQKDLNRFTHQHKFDEIISDLPVQTANKDRKEIEQLYLQFLKKCVQYVKRDGFIFAYTSEGQTFKKALRFYKDELELVKTQTIKIRKNENTLFILQVQ